jgi:hypothetical protein
MSCDKFQRLGKTLSPFLGRLVLMIASGTRGEAFLKKHMIYCIVVSVLILKLCYLLHILSFRYARSEMSRISQSPL